MMNEKLLVFGGSGQAKDVLATARLLGYETFQLVTRDGKAAIAGLGAIAENDFDPTGYCDWDCIVAIGNNEHRRKFHHNFPRLNFVSIIAPTAQISPGASIARGSFIGAFAYIGPDAQLGEACIVNTHSIVGHDGKLGDFSQIGPRACLCGHVEIGRHVFVGAGAVINNGSPEKPLVIADDVAVGMGCQITHSIKEPGVRLVPKTVFTKLRGD